eukprot:5869616-Prymnesium_polylepis.2
MGWPESSSSLSTYNGCAPAHLFTWPSPSPRTPPRHNLTFPTLCALAARDLCRRPSPSQGNDTHGSRFGDLHKDLAGIVWELSKLRTDMARWQSLSYLAGQSGTPTSGGTRIAGTPVRRGPGTDLESPAAGD